MMRSPVLLIAFNRPDTTRRVLESIRSARPPRLYFAVDGPRPDRPSEAGRCESVRSLVDRVDWPCEVRTLFRESNLGCRRGVSSAIDWFFEHEPEGIVLEDDILPTSGFYTYCEDLLERYRNDRRVGLISGCNLIASRYAPRTSYFFSRYNHIWGWASWRRAWQHYDVSMDDWASWRDSGRLEELSGGDRRFERYWRSVFDRTYAGMIDTWDYQWTFAFWRTGMLAALPERNQQVNLGFGTDATHTTGDAPRHVHESHPLELDFPLRHPPQVEADDRADHLIGRHVFGLTTLGSFRRRLAEAPLLGSTFRRIRGTAP